MHMHDTCGYYLVWANIGGATRALRALLGNHDEKRSGDRIKNCNGQPAVFFSVAHFSPQPVHPGSPGPGLPGALFRMKKCALEVCELDTIIITLLMRFAGHLIVDGASFRFPSPRGL